jgi:hypothetical protein
MSLEDLPGGLTAEIDLDLTPNAQKEEAEGASSTASDGLGPPDLGPPSNLQVFRISTMSACVW